MNPKIKQKTIGITNITKISNRFSPSINPVNIGNIKDKPKKATNVPVKLNIRLKRI